MKKHILVLGLLAAVAVPASAEGIYIFGDVGQTKYSEGLDNDTALALGLGYNINSIFSVELGYHDLGGASASDDGDKYSVDFSAVQISGIAKLALNDAVSVYGRLGYSKVTIDASFNELSGSDSENKATFGIGASYKVNEKFALRADYTKFDFAEIDVSSLTVGATYAF